MSMEMKTARAAFKVLDDDGDPDAPKGRVQALVSVFGNVDHGGDRVMPGAFAETLAEWQAKGDPIPFIWSHQWGDPEAFVGAIEPADAKETEDGLLVEASMFLDQPKAAKVFDLLKRRVVTQFSFGYETRAASFVDEDGQTVRQLDSIGLFEAGPTLLGMNPDTQLLEAASLLTGGKAGRVLSGKNEKALRTARDLLDGVLASVEADSEDDDGKTRDTRSIIDPERLVRVLGYHARAASIERGQA